MADVRRLATVARAPDEVLYVAVQLAAREAVSTRTLDELLAAREQLGLQLAPTVRERAQSVGLELLDLGVKDLVLPGEMKTLLNRVIEAQKEAEANVILRREETAATRSMAQTAKVLAENPLLVRLKELEAYKELAAKVGPGARRARRRRAAAAAAEVVSEGPARNRPGGPSLLAAFSGTPSGTDGALGPRNGAEEQQSLALCLLAPRAAGRSPRRRGVTVVAASGASPRRSRPDAEGRRAALRPRSCPPGPGRIGQREDLGPEGGIRGGLDVGPEGRRRCGPRRASAAVVKSTRRRPRLRSSSRASAANRSRRAAPLRSSRAGSGPGSGPAGVRARPAVARRATSRKARGPSASRAR